MKLTETRTIGGCNITRSIEVGDELLSGNSFDRDAALNLVREWMGREHWEPLAKPAARAGSKAV